MQEAVKLIDKTKPDLAFFDIELPDGKGFDILEKTSFTGYEVIFQTAFNDYAMQAFEASALHYLLKPLDFDKVNRALEKYKNFKTYDNLDNKLRILKDSISSDKPNNILLPSSDGLTMYNINEIVRCVAETNYTRIFLNTGENFIVGKNLQNFDSLLGKSNFARVHNSHLVNLKYVRKYKGGKHSVVVLTDTTELPVSEHKKEEFREQLSHFAKSI